MSLLFIPKGTIIIMHFYALHRSHAVYGSDADSFDPDRWDSIKPGHYEYMTFGGGSRICVGQHKALCEASYILVRLAQAFKSIESRDHKPWTEQVKLIASNANGCKVGLIKA